MTPGNLIRFCANQGIRLSVVDGELHAKGKSLTDKRAAWLKDAKEGILRYLHFTADPRPDLAEDHDLWQKLLPLCYEEDGDQAEGAFGVLHGLRCCGGRLLPKDGGGYILAGDPAETDRWPSLKARWLVPRKEAISRLLKQLT